MAEIEIIAECGVNHNGDFGQAKALVESAWAVGCDTVKFQLFGGDRYPELQLSIDQLGQLRNIAREIGLKFLCTPDDMNDAREIKLMGCDRIKIGSSNVTNIPLLKYVRTLDMEVVLSTGACTKDELLSAMLSVWPTVLMHCVSAYPSPVSQLNLATLESFHDHAFYLGYSDHTIGENYHSALVALGLGARVFEKHFTGSHYWKGPDHRMSADIHEMRTYVNELRLYAEALGDGNKRVQDCEKKNRDEYLKFVEAQHAHGSPVR